VQTGSYLFFDRCVDIGQTLLTDSQEGLHHSPQSHQVLLTRSSLCDFHQLPQYGVVGTLQGLDSDLLWHGPLLNTSLQQPVAATKQVPPRQVMSTGNTHTHTHQSESWEDLYIHDLLRGTARGSEGSTRNETEDGRSYLWKAVSLLRVDRTL
jgi:hypothetical protein